ncbi:RNA polymerase sigma factor [Aurantivibrio plasticivorans]
MANLHNANIAHAAAESARPHDAEGTSQSLNDFFASVEGRAYQMAKLATKSHAEALDVVQEAMIKLATNYADKSAAEWAPLFQTILQREIIQSHRRQQRQHRWFWQKRGYQEDELKEEDPIDLAESDESEMPDSVWQRTQDIEAVMHAVEQLSIRQQQAFLLRSWEGFDVETTANIMQCSSGSVKTHYSRAVRELRKQLMHMQHEYSQ